MTLLLLYTVSANKTVHSYSFRIIL